jgi:4-hydroxy-tetrahydrodipicolinate synthase
MEPEERRREQERPAVWAGGTDGRWHQEDEAMERSMVNETERGNHGTAARGDRPTLRGALTALVTPFRPDGRVDEAALRRFVRWQVLAGIDGLVPCGTTGEVPTLSPEERERVIAATLEAAAERPSRSRISVVAGTGTNDTAATIRATRRAAELGADAALVVAPYYNRPNQRMLEAHFRAVADDGGLPVVVYNVPSRTGTNVEAETLLRLAEHPQIIGVKEASGNLEQIAVICRDRPRGFAVLAGDDAWTLAVLAMGGDGVVSVASNEIPGEMAALCAAARAGDWEGARRIHERWLPLFRANFAGGPNPSPVKTALALMGLMGDTMRLPLLPLDGEARRRLEGLLRELGLLDAGGGRGAAAGDELASAAGEAAGRPTP